MKKTILIIISISMTLVIMSGCTNLDDTADSLESTKVVAEMESATDTDPGYGAAGSFENPNADIEQMLIYAIQDEYLARAEYEFLINELNAGNPFTNIMKAEETHIAMLIPLFEKYGFSVPEDTSSKHIISVESITAALEAGVHAEVDNIAMYEKFLEGELPDDIREAFVSLRDASEKHLAAFERKLSR